MKRNTNCASGWRWMTIGLAAAICEALPGLVDAAVYTVSPDGTSLSSIVNSLQPGDIVNVEPGTYHEAMKITVNGTAAAPITIQGVGASKPVFDAAGVSVSGVGAIPRAIFQIEGANIVIKNLELKNARNSDGNGAGIRLLNSTNAVISDCKIDYSDMGMMGNDTTSALIEGCDVGFNGTTTAGMDGYSHNFYMDGAGAIILRGNYIHDALNGQNFKSRAHYNELWYNWISNSNEGEIGPVDSINTATPNSNFLMVGNTVVSKPDRTGNHVKYINFGADGGYQHNGTMYIYNNTLIANDSREHFIWLSPATSTTTYAVVKNDLFYGSQTIVDSNTPSGSVTGSNNWIPSGATVSPGVLTAILTGSDPKFLDAANDDFRLLSDSASFLAGTNDLTYIDGAGVLHAVSPDQSYLLGQGLVPRDLNRGISIGAYEVPEPSTFALLAVSMAGLLVFARRRQSGGKVP